MEGAGQELLAGLAIRPAETGDVLALERLIAASARALSDGFYTSREIEAAIEHMFGVDTDLVRAGGYFVAAYGSEIAGCGGWSRQRTLFGGDRFAAREEGYLDPATEAAAIRAFFVVPHHSRHGIATQPLSACEAAIAAHGFARARPMATLPGVPFYATHGYRADAPVAHLCGTIAVRFTPMWKQMLQK
jgi:GNAT superfamily N-acetyltransferase